MKFHIVHDWGKYGQPFDSTLESNVKCQAKECKVCGKVHVSKVKSPWLWYFNADQIVSSLKGQV